MIIFLIHKLNKMCLSVLLIKKMILVSHPELFRTIHFTYSIIAIILCLMRCA